MTSVKNTRISIFVSYKHGEPDESILDEFLSFVHKDIAKAGGSIWTDKELKWGEYWDPDIKRAIAQADVIVLLVSNRWLNSEYIVDVEIPAVESRLRNDKNLFILPLILSPINKKYHKRISFLSELQYLPTNGQSLEDFVGIDRRELFQEVVKAQLLGRIADLLDERSRMRSSITSSIYRKMHEQGGLPISPHVLEIEVNHGEIKLSRTREEFLLLASDLIQTTEWMPLRGGMLKIATHSLGPWPYLDDELTQFANSLDAQGIPLSEGIRLVCPFSLSNLKNILRRYKQGFGIRICPDMDRLSYKWMIGRGMGPARILIGHPEIHGQTIGEDTEGKRVYRKAATGLLTHNAEIVTHFDILFEQLYQYGLSLDESGVTHLASELVIELNRNQLDLGPAEILDSKSSIGFHSSRAKVIIIWDPKSLAFCVKIKDTDLSSKAKIKVKLDNICNNYKLEEAVIIS